MLTVVLRQTPLTTRRAIPPRPTAGWVPAPAGCGPRRAAAPTETAPSAPTPTGRPGERRHQRRQRPWTDAPHPPPASGPLAWCGAQHGPAELLPVWPRQTGGRMGETQSGAADTNGCDRGPPRTRPGPPLTARSAPALAGRGPGHAAAPTETAPSAPTPTGGVPMQTAATALDRRTAPAAASLPPASCIAQDGDGLAEPAGGVPGGAYPWVAWQKTPGIDVTPGGIRPEYFANQATLPWQNPLPAHYPPATRQGGPRTCDGPPGRRIGRRGRAVATVTTTEGRKQT
jgi:hypothetical protein